MDKQRQIQEAQVKKLLQQYRAYTQATEPDVKKAISDGMFFADPVIWILYKYHAYKGSGHDLATWSDLITHSSPKGDICGKRLTFLRSAVKATSHVDIFSPNIIPRNTSLLDVARSPYITSIIDTSLWAKQWTYHEHYQENGIVSKWQLFISSHDDMTHDCCH